MTLLTTPFRYRPMRKLRHVDNIFADLERSFFGTPIASTNEHAFAPTANVIERDEDYLIELELPAIDKNDISVSFKNNILTVKGKREDKNTITDGYYSNVESSYGAFERQWSFEDVVAEKIEAQSKNGVLSLSLPKKKEAITSDIKEIAIK